MKAPHHILFQIHMIANSLPVSGIAVAWPSYPEFSSDDPHRTQNHQGYTVC